MSQDDPKKDDGKKPRQRKPAGTSRAKAPPARASSSKEPSVVDRDRLPTAEQEEEVTSPEPQSSDPWRHWRSWAVIALGVVVLLSFFALNHRGGSSNSASAPAVEPIVIPEPEPSASPESSIQPTTEEPPAPAPKPSPPQKVWEHEITAQQNTSFNIDNFPIKNLPTGFVITDIGGSGQGLEVVAVGKQVAWKGSGTPTYGKCVNALGSTTGTEHIPLQTPGKWICVETATQRIGRLRFDSASGYAYKFNVTVWQT